MISVKLCYVISVRKTSGATGWAQQQSLPQQAAPVYRLSVNLYDAQGGAAMGLLEQLCASLGNCGLWGPRMAGLHDTFAVAKTKGQGPLTERGGAFAEKKQKKNHESQKILCLGTCVGIAQRGD
jgi:hypothetical protein